MSTLNSLLKGELSWLRDNTNLSVLKLDGIEYKDLRFPNHESYRGGWKEGKPEGEGRYTWADSSTYEGAWNAGLKHGWGKYRWPNGASYQGEWRDGFMQGYGTFESPDGARYSGGWLANLKHGIGKKVYANGDSYEGLWHSGKAEGPGRYVWHNGNQYDGEWRAGKMHGQGTLKWITGERYDGEWGEGQEDGIGVFTWRDGSTYEGFWEGGKKTGVGVFRPAPHAPGAAPGSDPSARQRQLPGVLPGRPVARAIEGVVDAASDLAAAAATAAAHGASAAASAAGVGLARASPPRRSPVGSPLAGDAPLDSPLAAGAAHRRDRPGSEPFGRSASGGYGGGGGGEQLVYVCQYERGKLVHEEALTTQDLELIFGPDKHKVEKRAGRLRRGRKRQVRLGETVYKGHRSYDLMLNLQLGIRYTITTLSKLPAPARLTEEQFREKVWLRFPREGSEVTPPHPSNDFKWKDYCTTAFKRLRHLFGVDNSAYILSICGDQALREMPSPGKSGSVFFISHDDQYMIKTMHKEEIKLLLSMLPKYVKHVEANPGTLLTRFYGVHRVKPSHGRKVRFVVMNNVFRTDLELHRKFDLKGSTWGRTAGPRPGSSSIFKDLDLDVSFRIDPKLQASLSAQLAADCAFLESIHVMDYSLLLGLHRRRAGETSASPLNSDKEDNDAYLSAEEEGGEVAGEPGCSSGGEAATAATSAFLDASSASVGLAPSGDGSMALAPSGAASGAAAAIAAADSRRRRRSTSGLALAPTSDSDAEAARSMHSVTLASAASPLPSPRPEGRTASFLLKGLSWKSFTAGVGRRASQTQLAPALGAAPPPTHQPPPSAQPTPRVLPTPRLAAMPPAPTPHGGGVGTRPSPLGPSQGMAAAVRAAAAVAGSPAGDEGSAAAPQPPVAAANGSAAAHEPLTLLQLAAQQQQQQQQQQQGGASPGAGPAAEEGDGDAALPTWRSDAVQLPEQQPVTERELLAGGEPGSPASSLDGAGSVPRPRGSTAPPLGPILEQASPNPSQELRSEGAGEEAEAARQQQQQQQQSPQAQGTPLGGAALGRSPFQRSLSPPPRRAPGSPAGSSSASSAAATPTAGSRGLPLPGGVPRIVLQGFPSAALQPQPESNDWMHYAESVSESGPSAAEGRDSDLRSTQRTQRGDTPGSDGGTPQSRPPSRAAAPPMPLPAGGGSVDVSALLDARTGRRSRSPPPAAAARGGGPASAPATSRSPFAAAGAPAAAASSLHRLAQAAGPPAGRQAHRTASAAEDDSPRAGPAPGSSRGLGRTSSAPAGQLAAAALAGCPPADAAQRRRLVSAQHYRGRSMVLGREPVSASLASPEAAAVAGRANSRLTRRVTDQLVQDLVKLARYRMVGATAAAPSARTLRMPTLVLAARQQRRSGGAAAGQPPPLGHLTSSQDEAGGAGTPTEVAAAVAAAREPLPQRLGAGVPAVAVSRQAGQPPEEVLLFFGIIDFLQEYNMRKMLEHSFKAVVQDARGISVVEPRAYARRFLKFMDTVFPPPQRAQQQQQAQQAQQQQAQQ